MGSSCGRLCVQLCILQVKELPDIWEIISIARKVIWQDMCRELCTGIHLAPQTCYNIAPFTETQLKKWVQLGSNERSTCLTLRDGNNNILPSITFTCENDDEIVSVPIHGRSYTATLLVPMKRFRSLLFQEIISTLDGFLRVQERRSLNYKAR